MADHLDDVALSAILDGEDRAGADHARQCGTCRARLQAMGAAAAAVATPPPAADPAHREAAVSAALAAAHDGEPVAPGSHRPVTHLRDRRRSQAWLLASAAALAALALVGAVVVAGRGEGGDVTAAGDTSGTFETGAAVAGGGSGALHVGDLGLIGPGTDLRPVLEPALGEMTEPATAEQAPMAAESADGATAEAAPEGDERAASTPTDLDRCRAAARDRHGAPGEPVLQATATFDGRPAVVLAYRHGGRATVQVLEAATCDLLMLQSFDL